MKKYYKIAFLVATFLGTINVWAQTNPTKLNVEIKVNEMNRKLANCWLVITDGVKKDTLTSDATGGFGDKILLDAEKTYTLTAIKGGFATKWIEISTKGMDTKKEKNYYYPISIAMVLEKTGIDYSILKKPIAKIYFDKTKNDFSDDAAYAATIAKQLEKLSNDLK